MKKTITAALPGFDKWDTFAGGSFAAKGKNSYSIRAEGGAGPNGLVEFHISPISDNSGYHKGYSLTAFGIPGESGWRWISPDGTLNCNGFAKLFSKPQEAVKISQQVHKNYIHN